MVDEKPRTKRPAATVGDRLIQAVEETKVELKTCFGDECKALTKRIEELEAKLNTQSGEMEEKIKECVGNECAYIRGAIEEGQKSKQTQQAAQQEPEPEPAAQQKRPSVLPPASPAPKPKTASPYNCPTCKSPVDEDAKNCPDCGEFLKWEDA